MKLKKRTSKGIVSHTEKTKAVGSKYMKDITILREAESWIGLFRKFLEDPSCQRSGVPSHGAKLRQNHRASSHHRVKSRHREFLLLFFFCIAFEANWMAEATSKSDVAMCLGWEIFGVYFELCLGGEPNRGILGVVLRL